MNKIKNSKGFTLMEMLIVVAIIAVLVAIAIPTFTTSLNKARVAADEANIRSGYASVMAEILTNQYGENGATTATTYVLQKDGSVKPKAATGTTGTPYTCLGDASKVFTDTPQIAGITVNAKWTAGKKVEYVYTPATEAVGAGATTAAANVKINIVE